MFFATALHIVTIGPLSQAGEQLRTIRASVSHNAQTKFVRISDGSPSEADVAFVDSLPETEALWILDSDVDVELLARIIQNMHSLRTLHLENVPIGTQVTELPLLTKIEQLSLTGPGVERMPRLAKMEQLRVLVVGGPQFCLDGKLADDAFPSRLSFLTLVVSLQQRPDFEMEVKRLQLREKMHLRVVTLEKEDAFGPPTAESTDADAP